MAAHHPCALLQTQQGGGASGGTGSSGQSWASLQGRGLQPSGPPWSLFCAWPWVPWARAGRPSPQPEAASLLGPLSLSSAVRGCARRLLCVSTWKWGIRLSSRMNGWRLEHSGHGDERSTGGLLGALSGLGTVCGPPAPFGTRKGL